LLFLPLLDEFHRIQFVVEAVHEIGLVIEFWREVVEELD
jgi:hypothetical protein